MRKRHKQKITQLQPLPLCFLAILSLPLIIGLVLLYIYAAPFETHTSKDTAKTVFELLGK
jgi:hypothetical protein